MTTSQMRTGCECDFSMKIEIRKKVPKSKIILYHLSPLIVCLQIIYLAYVLSMFMFLSVHRSRWIWNLWCGCERIGWKTFVAQSKLRKSSFSDDEFRSFIVFISMSLYGVPHLIKMMLCYFVRFNQLHHAYIMIISARYPIPLTQYRNSSQFISFNPVSLFSIFNCVSM